ncbi:O-antigen ligase family protein [Bacteroides salyersiae]|uniref:O-antigen ligase family protein n=3 Tax=Bacteroides salyersiae TaxID=291644 RepID=UPI001CC908BA|nr:O-antigen ligase family protein [Bacteroides salyersiae]UBD15994.1 O-antigen ligase family protein [Bacteroides salyersiae]
MYFFNYIYFLIITVAGVKFLFTKQDIVTHPLDKKKKILLDGPELFWVLTFSTGLLAFSAPGMLDLMAIRLMILEIFLLVGLFIVKRKPQWNIVVILYMIYMIWLIIGLSYTLSASYGFRVILKYSYPLLIMLFASAAVRDKEIFFKAGLIARIVAIVSIGFSFIPLIGYLVPGVFWYGTARSIHYISMCIFSLALYYHGGKEKKDLLLCVLFMIPCILWVFRTSIMGTALAVMTFFFFRYKLKSIPVILGVLLLFIIAIFNIPSVKGKMFKDEKNVNIEQLKHGEISKDDINSNARFAMWEHLQKLFYNNNKLTGSGTGSIQNYMYSNYVFGGLKVPHNDYVQISCDNGLIGIVLYLLIIVSIITHCFIEYNKKNSIAIKMCAIVAGSSIAGVALTMYTDNVVNYSMATLSYPFGFYGMMLGLIKGKRYDFSCNTTV